MRIVLILFLSVSLLLGIGVAALMWLLDDDSYRQLGQWFASTVLDAELSFGSEFEFSPGRRIEIKSSQVTFKNHEGSLAAHIDGFQATIDLFALRHGTVLVDDLRIEAGQVQWHGSSEPMGDGFDQTRFLPLVRRANIRDLDIVLDPAGGTEPLTIQLAYFELDEPVVDQPATLRASGLLNGHKVSISGSTGSQRDLFNPPAEGFPVDLSASGPVSTATLSGHIANPIHLTGADLALTYQTESIQATLAAFAAIPDLGSATLTTQIKGDLRNPHADEVQIQVSRAGFTFAAQGKVESLYATDGIDLSLYASIDSSTLGPSPGSLNHANLHAQLSGADGALSLTDLAGFATLSEGGELGFDGGARWSIGAGAGNTSPAEPTSELEVMVVPRGFDPDQYAGLPELLKGLKVHATYVTSPAEAPAGDSDDADEMPGTRRLHTRLATPADASLQLDLTADLELGQEFDVSRVTLDGGLKLPNGTAMEVDGQIDAGPTGLTLTQLNLDDPTSGARIEASGQLGDANPDGPWGPIEVGITGTGDAAHLLTLLGLEGVQGINTLALALQVRGTTEALRIPQLSLDVGGDAGIEGHLAGHIGALTTTGLSGVDIEGSIRARSTADLGSAMGRTVPDLGVVQADGRLTDSDGTLGLETLTVRVTRGELAVLALTGAIDDILGNAEIHWAGAANIDLSALLDGFVDPDVDLGSLKGDFILSDRDGSLGVDSFSLSANAATVHSAELRGSFDDFSTFADLQADARIGITDTRTLNRLLGDDHGVEGPLEISGRVDGDPSGIHYQGKALIGRNHVELQLSIDLEVIPAAVTASVHVPALHPGDLGLGRFGQLREESASAAEPSDPAGTHLFSRTPLELGWLDQLRVDLAVQIDSVVSDSYALENLDVRARVARGELTLDRWVAEYSGGSFSGTARLANSTPPQAELRVTGEDVAFGELTELVFGTRSVRGSMSTRSELSTQGASLHDMASNLTGEVGLVLEHGMFPRRAIDLIGGDLFGWTMGSVTRRGDRAQFDCIIGRFSIDAGVLTTHALFLDGPNIAITGGGTINLGAETIDARFLPRNKRRFWGNTTPVHLTGSLASPTVTAIPARAFAKEAGTLAFVPQFYLPVRALGFMFGMVSNDDENSPCLAEQDRDVLIKGLPD